MPPEPTRLSTTYRPIWTGIGSMIRTRRGSSSVLEHPHGILQAAMHQIERAPKRGDLVLALDRILRHVRLARANVAGKRGDPLHRLQNEEVHEHVQCHKHDEE